MIASNSLGSLTIKGVSVGLGISMGLGIGVFIGNGTGGFVGLSRYLITTCGVGVKI